MGERVEDMAEVTWATPTSLTPVGWYFYIDRPLTRWEWVRVRILRRRDPRMIGYGHVGDGTTPPIT